MRKSTQFIAAAGFAGLVAVGGAAFTGSGLSTSGTAASDSFVGGTVSQSIKGATLTDISYSYVDASNTAIESAALTFADEAATYGKTITAVLSGGTGTNLTCTGTLSVTVHSVTCSSDAAGYTGASSLAVTVAS
ncbi:MAG: hypothetical protein QOI74_2045 [Micromonosporaceae bacterium]|nr:hypothetical protein [Micromonosporaceae bacterium]